MAKIEKLWFDANRIYLLTDVYRYQQKSTG